ncbi:hypothetical protein [Nitrosopumilus sp.]|uniref:hypothetical protein n=1 Tax=Nitrosopumilus sp. TaxID=2024843 RepID=UPI00247CBBEB|nr:hypothetical protein [Nitrosopumilus sp.]MCV0409738.1 hypothetical protein [Nitrosopumilus sp.]
MYNYQNQNKTQKHKTCVGIEYEVERPKRYTVKKAALFGMFSLLSILLLNVPIMLENTYAYGIEGHEDPKSIDEESLVRIHFVTGSPVTFSQIADYYDSNSSEILEERTNQRNHFSYEQTGISYDSSSIDNIHEKRRE